MPAEPHEIHFVDTTPGPCSLAPPQNALANPCPYCEHTGLVHPGPSNPALTVCALCEVQATIRAMSMMIFLLGNG